MMDWTVLRGEKYISLPGIETRFLDCPASQSLRVYRLRCLGLCFRRGAMQILGCNSKRGSSEKIAQWGASYLVLVAWWRGVRTSGWDVKHAWEMRNGYMNFVWGLNERDTLKYLDLNRVGCYMNLKETESESVDWIIWPRMEWLCKFSWTKKTVP